MRVLIYINKYGASGHVKTMVDLPCPPSVGDLISPHEDWSAFEVRNTYWMLEGKEPYAQVMCGFGRDGHEEWDKFAAALKEDGWEVG